MKYKDVDEVGSRLYTLYYVLYTAYCMLLYTKVDVEEVPRLYTLCYENYTVYCMLLYTKVDVEEVSRLGEHHLGFRKV